MYSPPQIILLGAALAAAAPIFPDITLTERSTKSFPPSPTNGTAPNNGTHRVDLHPVLKGCDKELQELRKCKAKDSHECVTEQANYSQCKKHEEIMDLIRKMLEKDPPVYSNVTVFARAAANGTAPTNDDPPVNNGDLPLIPLEPCIDELAVYLRCQTWGVNGSHECVAEQGNYSQCKKHEEMLDLIRDIFEKDPPVDANATVFARAVGDGTAPTNDDPPDIDDPSVLPEPPVLREPCLAELAEYLKCKKTGHGSHECVIERQKYHLCKEREGGDEELLGITVAAVASRAVAAPTDGTAPTNDDPPTAIEPSERCNEIREKYEKCKTTGEGSKNCTFERILYYVCKQRATNGTAPTNYDPEIAIDPKGPVASLNAPTNRTAPAKAPPPGTLGYELSRCNPEGYVKCLSDGGDDCDAELDRFGECRVRDLAKQLFKPHPEPKTPEDPGVFARAPASVPPPDSLRYKLIECNAKGYARCLSEGRGDCDAELPGPPKCDNGDLVRWLFAPGPKPEAPGATFKLLLRGPKDQRGNVLRDGEIVGNVYEAGARVHITGDVVLHGRVIGNAFGGDPDV